MANKKKKETIHLEISTAKMMKQQRGSWGDINPCSRIVESKKVYKRHPKHKNKIEI